MTLSQAQVVTTFCVEATVRTLRTSVRSPLSTRGLYTALIIYHNEVVSQTRDLIQDGMCVCVVRLIYLTVINILARPTTHKFDETRKMEL